LNDGAGHVVALRQPPNLMERSSDPWPHRSRTVPPPTAGLAMRSKNLNRSDGIILLCGYPVFIVAALLV
jgi:hypothetical protein